MFGKCTYRNTSCSFSNSHTSIIYTLNDVSFAGIIMRLPMNLFGIFPIIFIASKCKMIRIATSSVMTKMSYDNFIWNDYKFLCCYKFMSGPIFAISFELTIPCTCYRLIPISATCYFINSNIIFNEIHKIKIMNVIKYLALPAGLEPAYSPSISLLIRSQFHYPIMVRERI